MSPNLYCDCTVYGALLLYPNMNGVLSLGHFCETHGPCVMLCTQTTSEQYPRQPPHSLTVPWCNACKSIEVDNAFISHDVACTFVTTRTALKQDMAFLLKQACVRSLSCEVCLTICFCES